MALMNKSLMTAIVFLIVFIVTNLGISGFFLVHENSN